MGLASYRILGTAANWTVEHDGKTPVTRPRRLPSKPPLRRRQLALRQGHEVMVTAPGISSGITATGAKDAS